VCSSVVIESSFDPGERLQAPGSLWFILLTRQKFPHTTVKLPDTILEEDHSMTIPSKFGFN
jgi:hypothetical protein